MSKSGEVGAVQHASLAAETVCGAFQISAAGRPDQVALRAFGGGLELTFADFAARVRALAEGLYSLGVRRGDTVALMLTNRPEFSIADVAAMHLGAASFSVYNTSSPEQINHLFTNAGNSVAITERQFLPRVLEARTDELRHIVLVDSAEHGMLTLDELARTRVRGFDFEAAWRAASAGTAIPIELRRDLRLATTNAVNESVKVVDAMYTLAGGVSVYESSRLQRQFRDIHVATQHIMVAPSTLETVGRLLLGVDADISSL